MDVGEGDDDGPDGMHPSRNDDQQRSHPRLPSTVWVWVIGALGLLFAIGGYELLKYSAARLFLNPYANSGLPPDVEEMMISFDQDLDGVIGMVEFAELYNHIKSGGSMDSLESVRLHD